MKHTLPSRRFSMLLPYLELIDEPQVGRVHQADVVYPPPQHRKAVETDTEGEALIYIGVYARILQDLRVYHPSAHHFYPAVAQFLGRIRAGYTHIPPPRRLGERKEARTESYLDVRAPEQFPEKSLERFLEIRKRNVFAHREALHLKELRLVRHVGCFVAEHLARHNDAVWRLTAVLYLRLHVAYLDVGCMRAQNEPRLVFDEELVLHIPRRVVFGNVQRIEVVPFILEKRAFGVRKSHPVKDRVRLANKRRNWMDVSSFAISVLHSRQYIARSEKLEADLIERIAVFHYERSPYDPHIDITVWIERYGNWRRTSIDLREKYSPLRRGVCNSAVEKSR